MASSIHTHRVEIPKPLWEKLNTVAAKANVPTSQLIGAWLYEELHRRSRIPGDHAEGEALDNYPYRHVVREYARRERRTDAEQR